ncbi:Rep family protein [Microbacterium lacticum]|uniref:Rep family protein n=1 Tax=Microbacterium lacticum TaxID=33885 RepID=UPI001F56BD1A|nr:Rep family protein [Microbacterium lacticum]
MTTRKTSGPSGHKPPRYVTFTQQLKPEFWLGWDVALILAGDPRKIGEEVLRRYETAGGVAQGLWIIKHDRDVLADGSSKDDHVHVVLQQSAGPNVSGKLQCLAMDQIFGFGSKSVVRASPGRGIHIENALSYLIHAKDPDKYQYSPSEVVTIRGTDYFDIESQSENRAAWARRAVMARKASVPMREWNELGDALVQKVLDGEVDEVDILRDKTLMDIYTRNESKVNLALKNRARREMLFEVDKLRAGIFQKTIVWATGASDQGKTYLVESIAAELAARLGWPVFRATAKNGPDDYAGEPIFMMNEPSTKVMEWADFLTLLDPRQAGPISARFYNKPDAAPRVILIAVAVDPVEFGFFIPGKRSTNDSLDQLIRRITLLIEARKDDTGEPRYSVGQVGNVRPYMRTVTIPGQQVSERISLTYGRAETAYALSRDDALETVLFHVAERSPDAGLVIDETASIATRRHLHLVERGIVDDFVPQLIASPWENDSPAEVTRGDDRFDGSAA